MIDVKYYKVRAFHIKEIHGIPTPLSSSIVSYQYANLTIKYYYYAQVKSIGIFKNSSRDKYTNATILKSLYGERESITDMVTDTNDNA